MFSQKCQESNLSSDMNINTMSQNNFYNQEGHWDPVSMVLRGNLNLGWKQEACHSSFTTRLFCVRVLPIHPLNVFIPLYPLRNCSINISHISSLLSDSGNRHQKQRQVTAAFPAIPRRRCTRSCNAQRTEKFLAICFPCLCTHCLALGQSPHLLQGLSSARFTLSLTKTLAE